MSRSRRKPYTYGKASDKHVKRRLSRAFRRAAKVAIAQGISPPWSAHSFGSVEWEGKNDAYAMPEPGTPQHEAMSRK